MTIDDEGNEIPLKRRCAACQWLARLDQIGKEQT